MKILFLDIDGQVGMTDEHVLRACGLLMCDAGKVTYHK